MIHEYLKKKNSLFDIVMQLLIKVRETINSLHIPN